jgi:hypothetical protein
MKNMNSETTSAKQPHSNPPRLSPVTKWNEYHAWPPIGGLRHLIFFEKTNGFETCVFRVGKRVLIDEDAFFVWVKKDRDQASHSYNS